VPIHEYHCEECGYEFDQVRKYGDPVQEWPCSKCGKVAQKIWRNGPEVREDYKPRWDEQLGCEIKSRRHLINEVIPRLERDSGGRMKIDWH
jgi:putative FmdB family regulatory protein